jgi:hypothetical protein
VVGERLAFDLEALDTRLAGERLAVPVGVEPLAVVGVGLIDEFGADGLPAEEFGVTDPVVDEFGVDEFALDVRPFDDSRLDDGRLRDRPGHRLAFGEGPLDVGLAEVAPRERLVVVDDVERFAVEVLVVDDDHVARPEIVEERVPVHPLVSSRHLRLLDEHHAVGVASGSTGPDGDGVPFVGPATDRLSVGRDVSLSGRIC